MRPSRGRRLAAPSTRDCARAPHDPLTLAAPAPGAGPSPRFVMRTTQLLPQMGALTPRSNLSNPLQAPPAAAPRLSFAWVLCFDGGAHHPPTAPPRNHKIHVGPLQAHRCKNLPCRSERLAVGLQSTRWGKVVVAAPWPQRMHARALCQSMKRPRARGLYLSVTRMDIVCISLMGRRGRGRSDSWPTGRSLTLEGPLRPRGGSGDAFLLVFALRPRACRRACAPLPMKRLRSPCN